MPANNRLFWKKKLTGNKLRDRLVSRQLRRQGWTVVRIWEHELPQGRRLKDEGGRQKVVEKIWKTLRRERVTR